MPGGMPGAWVRIPAAAKYSKISTAKATDKSARITSWTGRERCPTGNRSLWNPGDPPPDSPSRQRSGALIAIMECAWNCNVTIPHAIEDKGL